MNSFIYRLLACYLTFAVSVGMVCPCCPACCRDSGRPPRHGRFCLTELTVEAVAVRLSIACPEGTVQGGGDQDRALGVLAAFRRELYWCFSKRPGRAG